MKAKEITIGIFAMLLICLAATSLYGENDPGEISSQSAAIPSVGPDTIHKMNARKDEIHPCRDMLPLALEYRNNVNYQRNPATEAAAIFVPGAELNMMLGANDTLIVVLGKDSMNKTCIIMFPKDPALNRRAQGYAHVHQTFPAIAPMQNFDYNALFSCQ